MILFIEDSGAAPSGGPVFLSHTDSPFPTASTSHVCNLPTTVSGDLLIALVGTDGSSSNSAVATPSGWTALGTTQEISTSSRGTALYRVADGSESGGTVDFQTTGSEEAAVSIVRVQAGSYVGTPEAAFISSSQSLSPPSASLTPTWGSANNLWITALFLGRPLPTGYPYPNNQIGVDGMSGGASGSTVAACTITHVAASLSPPTWSVSPSIQSVSATIAIRPA